MWWSSFVSFDWCCYLFIYCNHFCYLFIWKSILLYVWSTIWPHSYRRWWWWWWWPLICYCIWPIFIVLTPLVHAIPHSFVFPSGPSLCVIIVIHYLSSYFHCHSNRRTIFRCCWYYCYLFNSLLIPIVLLFAHCWPSSLTLPSFPPFYSQNICPCLVLCIVSLQHIYIYLFVVSFFIVDGNKFIPLNRSWWWWSEWCLFIPFVFTNLWVFIKVLE